MILSESTAIIVDYKLRPSTNTCYQTLPIEQGVELFYIINDYTVYSTALQTRAALH